MILKEGKHAGKHFDDIIKEDPKYADYILNN
jgi:hypothetical protein